MTPLTELSLFSGYGGFSLGLRLVGIPIRTIGYCEIEPYCQEIIKARIRDGELDDAPIYADIRAFLSEGWAEQYSGLVDVLTGGFPCQDISVAGKGLGIDAGERSGLWREMVRAIGVIRPRYALLENVSAILVRGLDRVLGDLAEIGYDAVWTVVSAADAGASQLRKRWWCLAYPQRAERGQGDTAERGDDWQFHVRQGAQGATELGECRAVVGHAEQSGLEGATGGRRYGTGWASGKFAARCNDLPQWPPGPSERAAWAGILARWPELAPAVADAKERRASKQPEGDYGRASQSPTEKRPVSGASGGSGARDFAERSPFAGGIAAAMAADVADAKCRDAQPRQGDESQLRNGASGERSYDFIGDTDTDRASPQVADAPNRKERQTGIAPRFSDAYGLSAQSPVLRVATGTPDILDVRLSACRCSRVSRLKALGNGICPPQAALAIRRLFAMLEANP